MEDFKVDNTLEYNVIPHELEKQVSSHLSHTVQKQLVVPTKYTRAVPKKTMSRRMIKHFLPFHHLCQVKVLFNPRSFRLFLTSRSSLSSTGMLHPFADQHFGNFEATREQIIKLLHLHNVPMDMMSHNPPQFLCYTVGIYDCFFRNKS